MGKTVTANGNASINTTTKKFGAGSCSLDGTGDYLSLANHADFNFGTGNFTIDCWANFNSLPGLQNFFACSTATGAVQFYWDGTDSKLKIYGQTSEVLASSVLSLSTGTWYHIAYVRSGNVWYVFVDGVNKGSVTDTRSLGLPNHANGIMIGAEVTVPSQFLNGYIDEFRAKKGDAVWTTDFTPPTAEYLTDSNTVLLLHLNSDFTDYSDWLNSVADATHSHVSDAISLLQVHNILVDEAIHSHVSDAISLTQVHNLLVNEAIHSHVSDAISLTQVHNLLVNEAIHSHVSDAISLIHLLVFTKQKQIEGLFIKEKEASWTMTKQKQISTSWAKEKQS